MRSSEENTSIAVIVYENYIGRAIERLQALFIAMFVVLSVPVSVHALGFGVPVLKSHLNEVLDVRVPLLLMEGESLNSVFVEFAKPDEYRLVGLEPYTDLSGMRISVEHMKHGELYVMLTSVSVVQAPIISLLLKARIGHNTYYKHVQILLDTMELGARTYAVAPRPKMTRMPVQSVANEQAFVSEDKGWARTWRYGPVRAGDSLSTIAYRLRRDKQWSNHDVVLGLYRFNQEAFIDHDINRLKAGVWLEVPHEETLAKLLKQAPSPYENIRRVSKSLAKNISKPIGKAEQHVKQAGTKASSDTQLRYVGHIALSDDAVSSAALETSSGANSMQVQEKLDQLYQQSMNNHLQMASLDKSITAIRDDIGKLSDDIIALKKQQKDMQQHMNQPDASQQYWMLGFLLLSLLNIILVALFLYHKHNIKKKGDDSDELHVQKQATATVTVVKKEEEPEEKEVIESVKKVRRKHLLENKMYDIENYLKLKDYTAVENILSELSQSEHEHFAISALKVRLYHETGRLAERDALIREKKSSLSEKKWHLLCDRLPTSLWQSLQESGVVKGSGTLLDAGDASFYLEVKKVDTERNTASESDKGSENYDALLKLDETLIHSDASEDKLEYDDTACDIDDTVIYNEDENSLEMDSELQSDVGIAMQPVVEETGADLSTLTSEVVDMDDKFLELDEHEFEVMDDELPSEPADEFTSTVLITLDGKKKR